MRRLLFLAPLTLTILPACGDKDAGSDETSSTGETDSGTGTDSATTTTTTATTGETGTSTTTSAGTDTTGTGGTGGFVSDPDGGAGAIECDIWAQDCMEGEKCMPWANDGGSSWNATKCSPVDPNPKQPGDECTVEGSGVSGVDDCDVASMCWDVDPELNTGTCVPFCEGSPNDPMCADANLSCSISNDGVLILCLPLCDPILQDCPDGNACYPEDAGFFCSPDASGDMGTYGDPCEYLNVCDPGLWCADASAVPNCQGSIGCCTTFCETTEPNTCPGMADGEECVPMYEEGTAPPGYEDVGGCVIPQ